MTPRQLFQMAHARQSEAWNHTASLICVVVNMMAKSPHKMEEFHPMMLAKKKEKPGGNWADVLHNKFKPLMEKR